MKKLIAIAVVFALVAGVAFAADVGVDVFGNIELINGTSVKDTDAGAGGGWGRTQFGASGENEDGTFGGWFRFRADGWGGNSSKAETWGNAWWKPIPQIKFLIGGNNDGLFGADGIGRWGFYQVGGDVGVVNAGNAWGGGTEVGATSLWVPDMDALGQPVVDTNGKDKYIELYPALTFSDAFYGGWDKGGAVITITPIDALEINIAVPFFRGGKGEGIYKRTAAQVAYNIDGIGKLAFTWDGYGSDGFIGANLGTLFTYFNLTAIENLSVDLGIGIPFIQGGKIADKDLSTFKMAIGLGVKYDISSFGVKFRFVTGFGGTTYDGKTDPSPFQMVFDLMPYYAINDKVTVNLSFGMGVRGDDKDADGNIVKRTRHIDGTSGSAVEFFDLKASEVAWHIYPYVTIKSSWWAPNFYAGVKLDVDGSKDADDKAILKFSVPIGLAFSF